MYNLQEYKDSYTKKLESLWQYHRNDANDNITDCKTFKLKTKKNSRRTPVVCNTEDVQERAVLLKYVSNFCRTLQIPLINCEKKYYVRLVKKLHYYHLNRSRNICNNICKTLRSCGNSITDNIKLLEQSK